MTNFTKCGECSATIPKNAKSCRHCGVKRKNADVSWTQAIGALIGLSVAAYFIMGINDRPTSNSEPSDRSSTVKTQPKPKPRPANRPTPDVDSRTGEFATIRSCLAAINAAVGPLKIERDLPDQIFGGTKDGRTFYCSEKVTGSKGTYYLGYYEVL